jgi:hypothetical protein
MRPGGAYLVFGSDSGFPNPLNLSDLNGQNGTFFSGDSDDDFAGTSVSGAGDINGDGLDDLIIGAAYADTSQKYDVGRSYVVFGSAEPFPATVDLDSLAEADGFTVVNDAALEDERAGGAVSTAGDFNGDGVADFVIGAPRATTPQSSNFGRAFVVFGRGDGLFKDRFETP